MLEKEPKVNNNGCVRVIIPTAKIVSEELQKLGKLPPIIYPVGKGIVFDSILKQYSSMNPMYQIICYEEFQKVQKKFAQYSSIDHKITILDQLGDLGETIYAGLEDRGKEMIINFADTIVMDNIEDSPQDCIYYTKGYLSSDWTFFDFEDGVIKNIIDKEKAVLQKQIKRFFIGIYKISDEGLFKQLLEEGIKNSENMDSFYYALTKYSEQKPISIIETKNWYDVGHAEKYYKSKIEVESREFNDIEIDTERGILRKQSKRVEKFICEILWYLKLPLDIEYVRPRIFSYSTNYTKPFLEMEYYSYHTLHQLSIDGELSFNQWMSVFSRIRFIINDFKKYEVKDVSIQASLEEMYLTKTIERLSEIKEMPEFSPFFYKNITINNSVYKSLSEICETLKIIIPTWLYDVKKLSIIHGDLCFANILIENNLSFIKLIDPRGKFGNFDIYGDPRYELAKLIHSIDGNYDYIINDKFSVDVSVEDSTIDFSLVERSSDFDLYDCFLLAFQEEMENEKEKIELIEALLFFSMIPLHQGNLKRQYVMLGTGIQILDRLIDIRA